MTAYAQPPNKDATPKMIDAETQDHDYPKELNRESAVRRQKLFELLVPSDDQDLDCWRRVLECALENNDVFALSLVELTGTTWVSHKINTGDAKPIKCKLGRIPECQKPIL